MSENNVLNHFSFSLSDPIEMSMYLDKAISEAKCKEINITPYLARGKWGYIDSTIGECLENEFYGVNSSMENIILENQYADIISDDIFKTILSSDDLKEVNAIIKRNNFDDIELMPGVISEYTPQEEPEIITCEAEAVSFPIPLLHLDITSTLSEQMSSILMSSNDYISVGNSSFCNTAELSVGCFNPVVFMDPMY